MNTHNDWLQTNLDIRRKHKNVHFSVWFKPYEGSTMNFHDAADYTCKLIAEKYSNIYISFSGGQDSEYVLRTFLRNKIDFECLMIKIPDNYIEFSRGLEICSELGITPIIHEVDECKIIDCFRKNIVEKYDGIGYNSCANIIAYEYVALNCGTLISGNHMIGEGSEIINSQNLIHACEWDFYCDYLDENSINVNFFLYTLELFKSMIPTEMNIDWDTHKHKLYGSEYRKKIKYSYGVSLHESLKTVSEKVKFPNKKVQLRIDNCTYKKSMENICTK